MIKKLMAGAMVAAGVVAVGAPAASADSLPVNVPVAGDAVNDVASDQGVLPGGLSLGNTGLPSIGGLPVSELPVG